MPVEIKELVIRAVVGRGAAEGGEEGTGPAAQPESVHPDEIVQECVRQVLRILNKDRER